MTFEQLGGNPADDVSFPSYFLLLSYGQGGSSLTYLIPFLGL